MNLIDTLKQFYRKAEGSAYIAHQVIGQTHIPYLPLEQLNKLRDRRVQAIVKYAAATVPYYQDLFRREKINPGDIQTAADLAQLPLITKQQLREQPEYFRSTSPLGQTAFPLKTSGSSGIPLTIYHDRYDFLRNAAVTQRVKAAQREILGTGRYRTARITFSGNMTEQVRKIVNGLAFVPQRKSIGQLSFLDPLNHVIAQLNKMQPDIIQSYGSYLELLYGSVAARNIPLHRPRIVIYSADSMPERARTLIEEQFKIPVHTIYGTVETFTIGFSCIARKGVHINDDCIHIRVIRPDGSNISPEETGEVVISNLSNRGTVLLNYHLGDLASFTADVCECGRTLPRLLNLEGRIEDILKLPSGRDIHPRAVWRVLRPRDDVVQYQLIQHTPAEFELRLAMTSKAIFDSNSPEIVRQVIEALSEPVTVRPVHVDMLEPYGIKKRRLVVSMIKQP
jgi:phenylacetate-CoA ligase